MKKADKEKLLEIQNNIENMRDIILSNAVLFAEIGAPTYEEGRRIQFLIDRFQEAQLEEVRVDETGNGMATIPGKKGKNTILIVAHADTVMKTLHDPAMSLDAERITGPGIAKNSVGLSLLASLPKILERLNIQFDDNIKLVGVTRSRGRGNLEGIHNFLDDHKRVPFRAGVCVEGVQLGRLSYSSIGMLRSKIHLEIPEDYDWSQPGSSGAIGHMNQLISNIRGIRMPREPKTNIIFGSVECGTAFNTVPLNGTLRFEIQSEDQGVVLELEEELEEILENMQAELGVKLKMVEVARRSPGGISFGHPLVKMLRATLEALDIDTVLDPSTGELTALLEHDIPSVTIGLTNGKKMHEEDEYILIDPLKKGITQLLSLLENIDQGKCDDREVD